MNILKSANGKLRFLSGRWAREPVEINVLPIAEDYGGVGIFEVAFPDFLNRSGSGHVVLPLR